MPWRRSAAVQAVRSASTDAGAAEIEAEFGLEPRRSGAGGGVGSGMVAARLMLAVVTSSSCAAAADLALVARLRGEVRRRACARHGGLLDAGDRAGDVVEALFERGDARDQPVAVGGERAHGLGQPPAFSRIELAAAAWCLTA